MQVRLAQHKDIDAISSVLAASWKTAYRNIVDDNYLDSLPENHWVDFLANGLDCKSIFAMVLEDRKHIIGGAILAQGENA